MLRFVLTTNRDYIPEQHEMTGLNNGHACILCKYELNHNSF